MKIQLDYKIDIEVKEGNKTKENLTIFFREFTKTEIKEQKETRKEFADINKKAQKLNRKQQSLSKKAELFELNKEYEKALSTREEQDKIEDEIEELLEELNELGGGNADEFVEKIAKDRFETCVSGKDKETLREYGEVKGFTHLLRSLDEAKNELEKKQSGE